MINYVKGDLIALAKEGKFDVIAHGCNCFNVMGAGIAPLMAETFGCDKHYLEGKEYKGEINKMGQIGYGSYYTKEGEDIRSYHVDKTNNLWETEGWKKNIFG